MKVNIDQTIEVSDEQRVAIARQIDGDGAKKRDATRNEMKEFIWSHGSNWVESLDVETTPAPTTIDVTHQEPDEDLLGDDLL